MFTILPSDLQSTVLPEPIHFSPTAPASGPAIDSASAEKIVELLLAARAPAILAGTAGLGAAGWIVGIACAATMAALLARGPDERLGPASWVTLARATLAVGIAALVADSFAHDTPVALLVALAVVTLALDLVDGWLARRTGTATERNPGSAS